MGNRTDHRSIPAQHRGPGPAPRHPSAPREGADNTGGFDRDTGFSRERGFGHIPGQRWGGGLNASVQPSGSTSGRGFSGNDFGPSAGEGPGHGTHGSDLGMGARDVQEARGPHYGKGPKGYQRSDARMREDLCETVAEQGFIDASDVEVSVTDGVVTLSGTVAHRQDKKDLEVLAEGIRGVEEVRNELRIPRPDVLRSAASSGGQNGRS